MRQYPLRLPFGWKRRLKHSFVSGTGHTVTLGTEEAMLSVHTAFPVGTVFTVKIDWPAPYLGRIPQHLEAKVKVLDVWYTGLMHVRVLAREFRITPVSREEAKSA